MASFVAEVLTSAGHLETQEATTKLQQLSKKIDSLKHQVYDITVNKHANFVPKLQATEQLVGEVTKVKEEMDEVSSKIENEIKSQLNLSTGEFQSLTGQLEDVNCLLVVIDKLVSLQDGFEALEAAARRQDYSAAADAVLMIQQLLSKKVYGHEKEIKIMSAIQTESLIQMQKLTNDLSEKWKEMVVWSVPDNKVKGERKKVELRLTVKGENSDLLDKVVLGMKKIKILDGKIKKFSEILFTQLIETLVNHSNCEVIESETGQAKVLTVSFQDSSEINMEESPNPVEVFGHLDKVLKFLNHNLLYIVVGECLTENDPPVILMDQVGGYIAEKTLKLIVKECLIKSIPTNTKDLEEFKAVLAMTEDVHKQLLQMKFITLDNKELLDFIGNVNILFANKKCKTILEKARGLMTTEVHNTTIVSHEKPLGELPPLVDGVGGGKKAKRDDLAVDSPLSANTFRLPTCHISTSIQQLMTMAYETLHEATDSSPQCAVQMFCAVRNMFELFCNVFPTYHKQSLETLPQFTALHYNNCMYIAHHLMTLGHQFSKKLPSHINSTFVDLVPKIRRLGSESFIRQSSKQKAQMSEYLKAANGFANVSEKDAFFTTERAVKQTLHQLQHLKKVWQDVLPSSNYRKAIGGLLNSVIVEIMDCVIALEDISTDDTKQLSWLLNMIASQAPELMEIPGDTTTNTTAEIQRNVAKWQRFKELDMILNASLIDIGDRWASGKGPLAVAFSANEVKQLIRALFQNTERRAAMLAKLK